MFVLFLSWDLKYTGLVTNLGPVPFVPWGTSRRLGRSKTQREGFYCPGTIGSRSNKNNKRPTRRALRNVITPIICTFGFLGNVVNIIVLSRLRLLRREARRDGGIHFGLIALAFSDMLFCVSMFPRLMVSESSSIFSDKNFRWFYQVKNPPDLISYTLQEEHTLLTGYHQPTKLREGNVFSHVCLSDSHSVHRRGTHCARAPSPGPLFTGHYMFKLVKL